MKGMDTRNAINNYTSKGWGYEMSLERIAMFLNVPLDTVIKYPEIALLAFKEQSELAIELLEQNQGSSKMGDLLKVLR